MVMRSSQAGKSAQIVGSPIVPSAKIVSSVHNNMRGITTATGSLGGGDRRSRHRRRHP